MSKLNRPSFDLLITVNGKQEKIKAEKLHYSNPENKDFVFYVDEESNCIAEFRVVNDELRDVILGEHRLGTIVKKESGDGK